MRRLLVILLSMWMCWTIAAQETTATEQAGYEHENVLYLTYGGEYMLDSYLSPVVYNGWHVGIGNEWWQTFRRQQEQKGRKWIHMGQAMGMYGKEKNNTGQNSTQTIHLEAGWGAMHVWQWQLPEHKHTDSHQLEVMAGPYLDADFCGKLLNRNVNKPVSFDIGLDAEVMAGVAYSFHHKQTAYRLRYLARINLIGAQWLPDYWQSYYEAYEGAALQSSIHLGYIGNRQYIHEELTMDMQLKRSCWRIGIRHEYLRYGTQDMPFRRQEVSLVVGSCWQFKTLAKKRIF